MPSRPCATSPASPATAAHPEGVPGRLAAQAGEGSQGFWQGGHSAFRQGILRHFEEGLYDPVREHGAASPPTSATARVSWAVLHAANMLDTARALPAQPHHGRDRHAAGRARTEPGRFRNPIGDKPAGAGTLRA